MKNLPLIFALVLASYFGNAQDFQGTAKIDPLLIENFVEQDIQETLIILKGKTDLSHASKLRTKEEKGRYVFETLKSEADLRQSAVKAYFNQRGISYKSYFIVNAIHAKINMAQLAELATLPSIESIQGNPVTTFSQPEVDRTPEAVDRMAITWGLTMIGAPEVWAMGYKGEGVVIGGQDTGYEWEHPALQTKYRGWNDGNVDHNYSWHDAISEISLLHNDPDPNAPNLNPCGLLIDAPCDDNRHGTHTMGTMVGSTEDEQIGVAPEAKWVGVRNMERGYGSPATYINGFEWFLAPTDVNDENPNPDMAPHVINNSWGCPAMEGCDPTNFGIMEEAVNNLKAAGIVVVVSAGNDGSGCETVRNPASIFENSFTIGATASNDTISGFSSRGPVTSDGSGRTKPDVSAPGQSVRSSVLNGEYASFSGTSMAGPHVAGTVALIISANPSLAGQVDVIENIIEASAVAKTSDQDCGGVLGSEVPNNTYGYGRIDALEAVILATTTTSLETNIQAKSLSIFPNPVHDQLNIELEKSWINGRLSIFNQQGQLIKFEGRLASDLYNYDATQLEAGIYFVQIKSADEVYQGKFVKI